MRLDRPYISVLSQHTRRVFIDLRCRLRGARADARAPRSGPCIEYSSPQGQARPALCAPRAPKSGPGRKTSEAISPRASLTQRAARGDLPPSRPGRCLDRGRGSGVWYRRGCLTGSRAGRPQHWSAGSTITTRPGGRHQHRRAGSPPRLATALRTLLGDRCGC